MGGSAARIRGRHENAFFPDDVAAPYGAGIKERWTCSSSRDKIFLMLRCLTSSPWGHMLSVVCGTARVIARVSMLVSCHYRLLGRSKKTASAQPAGTQQYCGSAVAYVISDAGVSYMVSVCARALRCFLACVGAQYRKYQKRFVACNHEPLIFLVGHQGLEPRTN